MCPKSVLDDDEEEEDDFEEETFKCRVCGSEVTLEEGDDLILLCDKCADKFDVDQIWDDFDDEEILEENLKTFDLEPYRLKKK